MCLRPNEKASMQLFNGNRRARCRVRHSHSPAGLCKGQEVHLADSSCCRGTLEFQEEEVADLICDLVPLQFLGQGFSCQKAGESGRQLCQRLFGASGES